MTDSAKRQAENRGRWGEWISRIALTLTGWHIVETGYRSRHGTGAGEIDIIARKGRVLAFIEVKTRRSVNDGLEAVTQRQRQRITRGAERYLAKHLELSHFSIRFDLIIARPWRWPRRIADAWRTQDPG